MMEYFSIQELDLPAEHLESVCPALRSRPRRSKSDDLFSGKSGGLFLLFKKGTGQEPLSPQRTVRKRPSPSIGRAICLGRPHFLTGCRGSPPLRPSQPVIVVRIDRQRATQEIVQNPELALALMKYLARTVRLLSEHIDNMAFLQTDQRIARYLLSLPQSSNSVIRCTQDEIASAVSANRVTVCRILNQFVKSGCIATGYGSIQVLDADSLRTKAAIDT